MRSQNKRYTAFALLVLALLLVSACTAPAPAAPAAPAAAQPAATEGEAAAPAPAGGAPVELTLWHMEQPTQRVTRIQELIDEFNASHPDIVVKQEPQNWGEIYTKAPAAVAAGNAPDMLFAIPDFTPILKGLDALQDVSGFVSELDAAHKFYPAAVQQYTYDGGTWAVPLYNMAHNLWYRPSVFAEAGIEQPKTWDELLAAVEKLTKEGQYGIGLPGNKNLYTDQVVYDFMINAGAEEIYNSDGTLRFNNPETVKAFDMYGKLYKFSPPDSANWAWGEAEACFANRTCAIVPQFTVISTYDTQAEGDPADLGVMAFPVADGVEQPGTISYNNAVMLLTKDAAKTAAAEEFIKFILTPGNYGRFLNMEPGLFLPVTEDGATDEAYWSDPLVVKYKSQVEQMVKNSENGMLFGFTNGNTFPSISAISAQNLVAQTMQKVVIDGMAADEAVAAGQALMEEAIAE